MKKLVLLATALLLCVLFCGCTDFDADFGIDEDCNAYMKYHIELDLADYDVQTTRSIKEAMTYFCDYYQNMLGFTVERDMPADKRAATADLTYTVECETYEEAFEALREMLSDPKRTPFLTVEMSSDAAEYEEGYTFSAEADFSKIMATSGYEEFPKDLNEIVVNGIDNAKGRFRITLPATTVVDSIGETEVEGGFCTESVDFSAKEPITLKLTTRLSREGGLPAAMSTSEAIDKLHSQRSLYIGIAIALGVLALAAVAMCIVLSKKSKALPAEMPADEALPESVPNEKPQEVCADAQTPPTENARDDETAVK